MSCGVTGAENTTFFPLSVCGHCEIGHGWKGRVDGGWGEERETAEKEERERERESGRLDLVVVAVLCVKS